MKGMQLKFVQAGRRDKLMGAEEELRLVQAWQERKDQKALDALVKNFEPLIKTTVKRYVKQTDMRPFMQSAAVIGLIRAIEGFDATQGTRLATYAINWMSAHIREELHRENQLIKTPRFQVISDAVRDPSLAEKLTPAGKMQLHLYLAGPISIDQPLQNGGSDGDDTRTIASTLADNNDFTADFDRHEGHTVASRLIRKAVETLNERERRVVEERFMSEECTTLEILAQAFGVSRERIRQIEQRALEKIRKQIPKDQARQLLAAMAA